MVLSYNKIFRIITVGSWHDLALIPASHGHHKICPIEEDLELGPLSCNFFIRLAINNRCWMVDTSQRVARLTQLPAPFVIKPRQINHILLSCVFTWQIWSLILQSLVLAAVAPTATAWHFSTWWGDTNRSSPKELCKGLNSIIIIVAWEVWKHKNSCVFLWGSTEHAWAPLSR